MLSDSFLPVGLLYHMNLLCFWFMQILFISVFTQRHNPVVRCVADIWAFHRELVFIWIWMAIKIVWRQEGCSVTSFSLNPSNRVTPALYLNLSFHYALLWTGQQALYCYSLAIWLQLNSSLKHVLVHYLLFVFHWLTIMWKLRISTNKALCFRRLWLLPAQAHNQSQMSPQTDADM